MLIANPHHGKATSVRTKLADVLKLLSVQKGADDGLLKDIQNGMGFKEAISRHPEHYTVRHAKG